MILYSRQTPISMKANHFNPIARRSFLPFGKYLLALGLFVFQSVVAKELTTVTHNVLHYPPYWEVSDGKIGGYHYKLAKAIYQEAGLEPNFVVMPYARIEAVKTNPATQVMSYGSAKADSKALLFPLPATFISLYSYSLKPNPPKTLSGYVEQRIALKRGFPLGEFTPFVTDKRFYTVELGTVDAAIQLLLFDRVDYVVTLSDPFEHAVRRYFLPEGTIHKTNLIKIYGHPMAINKANEKASELFTRINEAYLKLVAEGKIIHASHQTLLSEDFDTFINE